MYKILFPVLALCITSCAGPHRAADRALTPTESRTMLPALTMLPPSTGTALPESKLVWYDAKDLLVEGMGWTDTENAFERLPAKAEGSVPPRVWELSKNTAGIAIRFATDSKSIGAEWDGGEAMNHMAATGVSGLDLYRRAAGDSPYKHWEYVATGRPKPERTMRTLKSGLSGRLDEYILYLPLYHNLKDLKIGIEPGAVIGFPEARVKKPIVFYGTSITQGGCASRTGMCHTALVGRWLDYEVINLGFSGAGKMEPELADLLCEIDPSIYVLDCLPNMTAEMVRERIVPFVHKLRECRPEAPILLVGNPGSGPTDTQNTDLVLAYNQLLHDGVDRLYFLPADEVMPGEEEATVDGVHPTDLGFFRMAESFAPRIEEILDAR